MKNKSIIIFGVIYISIAIAFYAINQFIHEFSYSTRNIFVVVMLIIASIFNIIKYRKNKKQKIQ